MSKKTAKIIPEKHFENGREMT